MNSPMFNMRPVLWALTIAIGLVASIAAAGHYFGLSGVIVAGFLSASVIVTIMVLACAEVGARSDLPYETDTQGD